MDQRTSGGHILEILLFSLSSMLLYFTGVGIFLFLVPLQVVASRRGMQGLLKAIGAFLVVFLVIRFWPVIVSLGGTAPGHAHVHGGVHRGGAHGGARRDQRADQKATADHGGDSGGHGRGRTPGIPGGDTRLVECDVQTAMNGLFAEVSRTLSSVFTTTG